MLFLAGDACLYSVVKRSALKLGWKLVSEESPEKVKRNTHVIWIDRSFVSDKLFLSIQPWQRINHFPGMTNICRKTRLAQSLELMKKQFPLEYSFYPTTYSLPHNIATFKTLFDSNGQSKTTFIVKPDGSAQGKGIFLTNKIEDVENRSMCCVAQQYIRNPLLIDKKKFDLRIYVLVTSCSPLRVYLFRDGLVRLCTEEYTRPNSSNLHDRCMHLTNYSVNKRSDKYERDGDESSAKLGSKRSIKWLLEMLAKERSEAESNEMWSKVGDICVMTIISILPTLRREYNSVFGKDSSSDVLGKSRCFEVLGVDILIDDGLRPYLIEVNHLPSWGTDSVIDEDIKSRVIAQALSAINVKARDRQRFEDAEKRQAQMRLGRKQNIAPDDTTLPNQNGDTNTGITSIVKSTRQPVFFDSNSAERRIRAIYERHAPEKISRVNYLLSRFRGYEEWLVLKVEEKYESKKSREEQKLDESSSSDDSDSSSSNDQEYNVHLDCNLEEERVLEDYDRIYPPISDRGRISASRYKEMERFVTEIDTKQQQRLLCPLQQVRSNHGDDTNHTPYSITSRGDGWIGGNVHIRAAKKDSKVICPPTKKQVEFADRLTRGYSVGDVEHDNSTFEKKSRILQNDHLIFEEVNPFYQLIDRVRQSRELSKEVRQRAEKKLNRRTIGGTALKQQVIDLGLESPFIEIDESSKFNTKKKYRVLG